MCRGFSAGLASASSAAAAGSADYLVNSCVVSVAMLFVWVEV